MAPKKPVASSKPAKSVVEEFGPEDPLDEVATKDMAAPVMTPPERRKNVPREAIELGGGSACSVCGTIGTGVCPVDGQAR